LAFWCGRLLEGKRIAEGKVLEEDCWRGEKNCWRSIAISPRIETLRKLNREHVTVQVWGQRL
jgi:hypothetical protein